MLRILDQKKEKILAKERKLLNELRVALVRFGASKEDQGTLGDSIHQLDDLFLLVVVGEFNSGKSAFINALVGEKVLQEGVTPTTTQINILRHRDSQEHSTDYDQLQMITSMVDMLTEISIVDTPGTNAIIREHEEITSQFVPRSDLVLFITSADRPFTESERAFLERIRNWGKKVVVVLNKIDLFENEEQLSQVSTFINENARNLFGITPEIFPVSSRLAQRAKHGDPSVWQESRFEALESYIYETLDESGRVRLKFLNPLGVGLHLLDRYLRIIDERLDLLKSDFSTLENVEEQLRLYRDDMDRDFEFRMADIENVLLEMEQRGQDFFDETLRLGRIFDLLNKERVQKDFENRVVADVPQRIETRVAELIDWLVDADFRQWQAVTEHLAERRQTHKDRIVGNSAGSAFHHDRERLIEAVGREASRVVNSYDKVAEARSIADGARNSVAALAAVEVGAVGLGTLVAILATTATADITGVLLASLMAALGLFVLPARRRRAKAEMRTKFGELQDKLVTSLKTQFEREIERSVQKINESIAPYSRFVRGEREKLEGVQSELDEIRHGLSKIKADIETW